MKTVAANNRGLCVIVPVYNGMKYLDDCVKSVLSQTRRVEQVILVDDGSTDGTAERCDEYAAKYENIEVVHRPNGGLGFARNSGMEKCHCEYIGFVDVDDYPEPRMYEQMLEHIQKTGASLVCCDIKCITKYPPRLFRHSRDNSWHEEYVVAQNFEGRLYEGEEVAEEIVKPLLGFRQKSVEGLPSTWSKLWRKSVIDKFGLKFSSRTHGEDYQFLLEYLAVSPSIAFLHKPLYNYVHHTSDSLVSKFRKDYFKTAVTARILMERIYPGLPWQCEGKKREWNNMVYDTVIYYRMHLKWDEAQKCIMEMTPLISSNGLLSRYKSQLPPDRQSEFENLGVALDRPEVFCQLVRKYTNAEYRKIKFHQGFRSLIRTLYYSFFRR